MELSNTEAELTPSNLPLGFHFTFIVRLHWKDVRFQFAPWILKKKHIHYLGFNASSSIYKANLYVSCLSCLFASSSWKNEVTSKKKKNTKLVIKSAPPQKKFFFLCVFMCDASLHSQCQRRSRYKGRRGAAPLWHLSCSIQTPAAHAFTHLSLPPCAVSKGSRRAAGTLNTPSPVQMLPKEVWRLVFSSPIQVGFLHSNNLVCVF